jgi:CheY-like chemotaxis protein
MTKRLIIEDDASFAEVYKWPAIMVLRQLLLIKEKQGISMQKIQPKAIILDMKLPGINGWTVLNWLKEDKELQHIPNVMSV